MSFELPALPYAINALEPHISAETLEFHHGKHHQAYINTLNSMIPGTEYEKMTLEQIIQKAEGKLFNQAAQVWNHSFYWNCLSPKGGGKPSGDLAKAIDKSFGSFEKFVEEFTAKTGGNFASGWGWLVKNSDGSLAIVETDDADTPVRQGKQKPLLTCDVWEHAYYIDYRNARPKYLEAFWKLVNWEFVGGEFSKA